MFYPYFLIWWPHLLLYRAGLQGRWVWLISTLCPPVAIAFLTRHPIVGLFVLLLWFMPSTLGAVLCAGLAQDYGWRK